MFILNHKFKKIVNGCYNNPCQNGATCNQNFNSYINSYTCTCLSGYSGTNCQTCNINIFKKKNI